MEYSKELSCYINDTGQELPNIDPETAKGWIQEIGFFNLIIWSIVEFSFYGRARHIITSFYSDKFKRFINLNNLLADHLVPLIVIGIFSIGISVEYISYLTLSEMGSRSPLLYTLATSSMILISSRMPLFGGYTASLIGFWLLDIYLLKIYMPIFMQIKIGQNFSGTVLLAILLTAATWFIVKGVKKINYVQKKQDYTLEETA